MRVFSSLWTFPCDLPARFRSIACRIARSARCFQGPRLRGRRPLTRICGHLGSTNSGSSSVAFSAIILRNELCSDGLRLIELIGGDHDTRVAVSEFACLLDPTIDAHLPQHTCELLRLIVGLAITKWCLPRVLVRTFVFFPGFGLVGNEPRHSRVEAK